MPEESDECCIRAGKMDRKFMDARGVKWVSQYLLLTPERLLIASGDDPEKLVFDDVLLRCVRVNIRMQKNIRM